MSTVRDELEQETCAGCGELAFSRLGVVQCAVCETFQHRSCWIGNQGRCAQRGCSSKKWSAVVVVRLQSPAPSPADVAAAVHARFEKAFHPAVAELRTDMAHREDVERVAAKVTELADLAQRHHVAAAEAAGKAAQRTLDALAELRGALAAVDAAVREGPDVPQLDEIAAAVRTAAQEAGARVESGLRDVVAAVERVERTTRVEATRNLVATEACRWDTAARRSPLPWDGRSDDVPLPVRAAPAAGSEGK